jgi:hypothetical protein
MLCNLYAKVKRLVYESSNSPPSSANVCNVNIFPSTYLYVMILRHKSHFSCTLIHTLIAKTHNVTMSPMWLYEALVFVLSSAMDLFRYVSYLEFNMSKMVCSNKNGKVKWKKSVIFLPFMTYHCIHIIQIKII